MAVSVRAAYSMPHLHTMDFDLSPKNRFHQEARWGNSSPVLILSLLEIVERENDVHVQEAGRRLKPGWVRNACAAFEQGMDFSNFEKLKNVQHPDCVKKKVPQLVEQKNSQSIKPAPKGCTASRSARRIPKSTLPKSRSLESLNYAHQKDKDIVLLKDLKKDLNSSVNTSALFGKASRESSLCSSVRKKDISKLKRSKSTSDKSLPRTKPKVSTSTSSRLCKEEIAHPQAAAQKAAGPCKAAQRTVGCFEDDKDRKEQLQRPSPRETRTSGSEGNALIHGSSRSCSAGKVPHTISQKTAHSVDPVGVDDPTCVADGNVHTTRGRSQSTDVPDLDDILLPTPASDSGDFAKVCSASTRTDALLAPHEEAMGIITVGSKSQQVAATESNTCNSVPGNKVDGLKDSKSLPEGSEASSLPSSEVEEEEATPNHGMPSVRPKESLVHFKDAGDRLNGKECATSDAIARNFVVCQGAVSVCIKSSVCAAMDERENSFRGVLREGSRRGAIFQSAMCQSATSVESADLPSTKHKATEVAVVGKKLHSVPDEEGEAPSASSSDRDSDELSVRLQDKGEYPPELLGAYFLNNSNRIDNTNLEWKAFRARYTSYRHLSISRQRFTATFNLSVCKEIIEKETSSDHLANLRRAFEKKWSRPNVQIAKRGSKNFYSLNFQVRNHPLAYRDPYESEESESEESDEEWKDDVVTYFRLVPTYIIAKIFRHLKTRDLAALKCTCMDFNWLINHYDIIGNDSKWVSGDAYRNDPCMHCGKIQDPRGDVSLCRRHTKIFYKYSHIGRCYWTCCNAVDRETVGCQVGLHNNKWTTANFKPYFICKPWRSMAWYATANYDWRCDKEHL